MDLKKEWEELRLILNKLLRLDIGIYTDSILKLKKEGKNPFTLDSKEPTASFREFLDKQVRYTSLKTAFPEIADELFASAEEAAKERYETYKAMAER